MKAVAIESPKKSPSLGKTARLVAILTIVSKFLGLIRDQVVGFVYATTFLADAYNYAYLFTGNILILFGGLGGPFHSATVATLTPKKQDPESGALVAQVMACTSVIMTLVAVLMCLFAPQLVHAVASDYGLNNPVNRNEFFEEAIFQLRVMSPLVVIAGLIGVTYGVLNVFNKIFWPSLSPAIASIAVVIAVTMDKSHSTSIPLAVGTLIGAFGQLFAQMPGMFSCGLNFRLPLKLVSGVRDYCLMLLPAAVGTSIGQLIGFVDSRFCSGIEGGWTAICMANRLFQLPLGILVTAAVVPLLPRFTEQAVNNEIDALKKEFRRAISVLCFIAIPLTMVLVVLPRQIIQLLFQHFNFTEDSTRIVTQALIYLTPSMVVYIARDLITRVFYGFQDTRTPFRVAVAAILIKIALDWLFVVILKQGVAGISLATSIITVFNFSILAFLLRRKIGRLGMSVLIRPVVFMILAAIAGGFTTFYLFDYLHGALSIPNAGAMSQIVALGIPINAVTKTVDVLEQLVRIAVPGGLGCLVYGLICMALRLDEPRQILARFKRSQPSPQ
ncbi:MAG TPA: murein biosynthesis integral membrane protein MurJ [Chroococcales cyanobacterium]